MQLTDYETCDHTVTSTTSVQTDIEPKIFPVYSPTAVIVAVAVCEPLDAGSRISCQLPNSFLAAKVSAGNTCRLQTEAPDAPGYSEAVLLRDSDLSGSARLPLEIAPREFYSGCPVVRHGQCVTVQAPEALVPGDRLEFRFANMTSPWVANQEERVYVAVNDLPVADPPTFRVLPDETEYVRLIAPSQAKSGEAFPLLIVGLDAFHNRSRTTYSQVRVRTTTGETVAENLAFTGSIRTHVTLPENGVFRLEALGALSNPIRIGEAVPPIYWGDLHSHSDMSVDAVGHDNYAYAREVSGLDLCAVCDHGAVTHPHNWERAKQRAAAADAPGKFLPILAYEINLGYHLNIYFPNLEGEMMPMKSTGDSCPGDEVAREFLDRHPEAITQLHHTGVQFAPTDMTQSYHPTTRLLEIYSMHGQSEYASADHVLSYEHARYHSPDRTAMTSLDGPYYARDAWANGRRFATMASSDDHFAQPGKCQSAITAIGASELSREAVFDALRSGRCYGTTGERILLDFTVNGEPMGSCIELPRNDGALSFNLEIHGTAALQHIEVMRYRFDAPEAGWQRVWQRHYRLRIDPEVWDINETWEEPACGEAVYYARLRQRHSILQSHPAYAWSTPIWIGNVKREA